VCFKLSIAEVFFKYCFRSYKFKQSNSSKKRIKCEIHFYANHHNWKLKHINLRFSQNGIVTKRSIQPSLRNLTQQLNNIFSKTNSAPTTKMANNFFILVRARIALHLSALKATYIKTLKSIQCRKKEFVYSLQISH